MALQSSFYVTDGSTRTFPTTKHIATKQHVAVYLKRVLDSIWEIVDTDMFSLINNSIVFDDAPSSSVYSDIEIRVADNASELDDSPSSIAIVASNIVNINTNASNIANITTNATNINSINSVSANSANINTNATNIANINTNASNIANINSVASTVVPNITEILLADDNAATATTQAGIATTQAGIATAQAVEATTQVGIATTQAGIATTQATNSGNSATASATSASLAQSYAASIDPATVTRKDPTTELVFIGKGTTAQRPTLTSNQRGMWFNTDIGKYEAWNGTAWGSIGGGATGGGTDEVFTLNSTTVTTSYTIPTGKNAVTAGPITIADGATVTISDGSTWVVV